MDLNFDPYHKWLGIPPHEQPANLYRLLGVALFEPDLDVISGAADQRMAHLRSFQSGGHAALSQKILNEIARARVRLLDVSQKSAYDSELRSAIARVSSGGTTSHRPAAPKAASPAPPAQTDFTRRAPSPIGLKRQPAPRSHAGEDASYEVEDESLARAHGSAASVALVSPRAGDTASFGATTTRRTASRRGNRALYGIFTGGILGLVIGYLLLTNIKPEADFLGIFPPREEVPNPTMARVEPEESAPIKRSPAKRPANKPAEPAAPSTAKRQVGSSDTQPGKGQPIEPPKVQQPRVEPTQATPSRRPQKKVDPLTRLPQAVSLPKVADVAPVMLADFEGTDGLKIDAVELVAKLAESSAQNLAVQVEPNDGTAAHWLIGFAKEGTLHSPLARLRCDPAGLAFQWDKRAASTPLAAHLANAVLRFNVAGQPRSIALRKCAQLPPLVLEMTHKETSHRILDAPLPKADTIWLEVVGLERFPVRAKFKSDKSRAPFRKDAMSHVVLALDKLSNGADSPELQLRLVQTTTGGIDLKIVRVLNTARRGAFDLTRTTVAEVRSTAESRLKPIEQEIPDVIREIQSAKRTFDSVKAQPAVGIYNIAYKQQRLNALRAQITTLNARLTRLNKEKAELAGVLKSVPPVESLVSQLDSAKLEIRVFCQSGDLEIDLAKTPGDDAGGAASSSTADRAGDDSSAPNKDAPLFIKPKRDE